MKNWRNEQRSQEKELFALADDIYRRVTINEDISIPILVYYQSNRTVFGDVSLRENPNRYLIKQFDAYDNAFIKKANDFDDFAAWFRKEEDKENEIKVREKDFDFKSFNKKLINFFFFSFFY